MQNRRVRKMFPVTRIRTCLTFINPISRQRVKPHKPFRTTTTTVLQTKKETQLNKSKWLRFSAIVTRWMPLGSAFYVSWCYIRASYFDISRVELKFYEMFPFRLTSRLWGYIAAMELPSSLRPLVFGGFCRIFNVNISEAEITDLKSYKSLSDFFTRQLKDGVRVIAPTACVSPCDGTVLFCGPALTDRIEQVKGVTYSLEEFLGSNKWSRSSEDYYRSLLKNTDNILHQCIIYLAPGDYHRFHSPADWNVKFRRHFSGKLLSVNPWMARLIPGLFAINERAVYIGEWDKGFFSMTAVGATNVGSIEIYKDPSLQTNTKGNRYRIDEAVFEDTQLKRGEMFGQFNMGSTIILLFEAPKEFSFDLTPGQKVTVGQAVSLTAAHHQAR